MKLIPILVECSAGYKADETPSRFNWEDRWVTVEKVLDRWYEGGKDPEAPIADYFKVRVNSGRSYLIKHDRDADRWYLASSGPGHPA